MLGLIQMPFDQRAERTVLASVQNCIYRAGLVQFTGLAAWRRPRSSTRVALKMRWSGARFARTAPRVDLPAARGGTTPAPASSLGCGFHP